jgi:probable phosphoglycerate mutase
MITLYITRHGETEWNKEKRMQGWLDSNLTESGIKNAVSLGERLKETEFTAIYSSPSGRTKATTSLIRGERDIPVIYDENLKEIKLGQWEGRTHASIKEMYQTEFESFWNTPLQYTSVGGETFEETRARASQVLDRIKREYKSGNMLIVTHSVVIKCLFSFFKNSSIETLWDPPYIHDTSLTIVEMNEDGFKLILEGDITHLESVNFI